MTPTKIKAACKRGDRVLMVTYQPDGAAYSLDNGVAVPKRLAGELIGAWLDGKDNGLRLQANDDGLFPGFSQTWRVDE